MRRGRLNLADAKGSGKTRTFPGSLPLGLEGVWGRLIPTPKDR